jgi:hypothetical protein
MEAFSLASFMEGHRRGCMDSPMEEYRGFYIGSLMEWY